MADKQISSLPQAQTVDDSSLFVLEQQGTAMKATGAQWKGFAVQAVSQYVEPAQQAAKQAQQAAQQATQAVSQIGTAVEDTKAAQAAAEAARDEAVAAGAGIDEKVTRAETAAQTATEKAGQAATSESNAALSAGSAESAKHAAETAKQAAESAQGAAEAASGTATSSATQASQSAQNAQQSEQAAQTAKEAAEAAQEAIENLGVDATTLESGSPATVQKTVENGVVKLTFGLPSGDKGEKGDTGASMGSIERVSGTGAPGTFDTYNVVLTDGQVVGQFQVYNGADGQGAGDMLRAVYDPTGKNTDVFAYVDQAVQDIPVPDVSAQIAQHNADVSAHPDIRAELAGKEQAGAAAGVQSNLDTHVANKQNPHATTAEQVGADPEGSAAQALTDAKAYTDEKLGNIQAEDEIFVIPVVTPETFGVSTTTLSKEEIISALDAGKKIIFEVSVENIKGYKYPCYPFVTVNYMELGMGDGYYITASSTDYNTIIGLAASSEGMEVSVSKQSPYEADFIYYDNKTSGLTAKNVQDAIDELNTKIYTEIGAALEASY